MPLPGEDQDDGLPWPPGSTAAALRSMTPAVMTPDEVITKEMPKEVSDWFTKLKVTGEFSVTPHKLTADGFAILPVIKNRIPTKEELGQVHGPGKYRLAVEWAPSTWKSGSKTEEGPWFELSETGFQEMHEDYLNKRTEKRRARTTESVNDPFSGLAAITPIIQTLVQSVRGAAPAPSGGGMDSAVLVALITSMNQQSMNMMTMMQKSSEQSTAMLLRLFENKNQNQTPDGGMGRIIEMVEKVMQVKDLVNGKEPEEKESMLDRLMGAAAQLLPHIGSMLANLKSAPAMARPYMVQGALAQQPRELRDGVAMMQNDAAFRAQACERLRAEYGEGAEEIIEVMNMAMPKDAQVKPARPIAPNVEVLPEDQDPMVPE